MAVFTATVKVFLKAHSVLGHPSVSFKHTLGENEVNIAHLVLVAPKVDDIRNTKLREHRFEIHLVNHTFDVRHTDLKRRMDMLTAEVGIHPVRKLAGDQSFPVKLQDLNIRHVLHAGILTHTTVTTVIRNGYDICFIDERLGILYDNHPLAVPNAHVLIPMPACEHQTVVGVEFGKLAFADLHIQHHSAAKGLIEILTDKGQLGGTAHTARPFKGEIAVRAAPEIQTDPFGAEHGFRLFLSVGIFLLLAIPVENASEIHIYEDIQKCFPVREGGFVSVLIALD